MLQGREIGAAVGVLVLTRVYHGLGCAGWGGKVVLVRFGVVVRCQLQRCDVGSVLGWTVVFLRFIFPCSVTLIRLLAQGREHEAAVGGWRRRSGRVRPLLLLLHARCCAGLVHD